MDERMRTGYWPFPCGLPGPEEFGEEDAYYGVDPIEMQASISSFKCHHCNRLFSNQLMLSVHYMYCPEVIKHGEPIVVERELSTKEKLRIARLETRKAIGK